MSEFIGELITMDLPDGRKKVILFDFAFANATGAIWPAFRGDVIDGATIPKWAWSIFGSPYCGKYRRAAALHDTAYMYQLRGRKLADEMLSEAACEDGCKNSTCWILERAVRNFGQTYWDDMDQGDRKTDWIPAGIMEVQSDILIPDMYKEAMVFLRTETEEAWAQLAIK